MTDVEAAGAADATAGDGGTLPFWVEPGDEGDTMGLLGGDPELRAVPLGPLRRNLAATVDALQQVFADIAAQDGTLPLAEAQLSFQVTANGGVQLIGTGQVGGSRALTLTFRRP